MPIRVLLRQPLAPFGTAHYRMAETPSEDVEILLPGFLHAKKGTWPSKDSTKRPHIYLWRYFYVHKHQDRSGTSPHQTVCFGEQGTPDCPSRSADGRITNSHDQQCVTIWGHLLASKAGTAMGAPPAPPWVTIFFGIHEETVLAIFGQKLQLYCRFIDNVLGIWLVDPDPVKDCRQWMQFVELMQDYYGLEWIFEERPNR